MMTVFREKQSFSLLNNFSERSTLSYSITMKRKLCYSGISLMVLMVGYVALVS